MTWQSRDHRPMRIDERKRIEDAGGTISDNRIWTRRASIAVSRAIGDWDFKNPGLVSANVSLILKKHIHAQTKTQNLHDIKKICLIVYLFASRPEQRATAH